MDYNEFYEYIINLLDKTKYAVLATSSKDNIVSASYMSIVSNGLIVYCQSDSHFEKVKNILENPNVALTIGNAYFKGNAHIVGKPTDNEYFVNKLKEKDFRTYENYSDLENQVLIEIKLTEGRIWGMFQDGEKDKCEEILISDFEPKVLKRIKCNNLKGGY